MSIEGDEAHASLRDTITRLLEKVDTLTAERDALLADLTACAEALSITRGQWIHSVNKDKCLAALARPGVQATFHD